MVQRKSRQGEEGRERPSRRALTPPLPARLLCVPHLGVASLPLEIRCPPEEGQRTGEGGSYLNSGKLRGSRGPGPQFRVRTEGRALTLFTKHPHNTTRGLLSPIRWVLLDPFCLPRGIITTYKSALVAGRLQFPVSNSQRATEQLPVSLGILSPPHQGSGWSQSAQEWEQRGRDPHGPQEKK